ncbi:MAG: hypothetical protein WC112_06870 [Proteiniphilum sp.]
MKNGKKNAMRSMILLCSLGFWFSALQIALSDPITGSAADKGGQPANTKSDGNATQVNKVYAKNEDEVWQEDKVYRLFDTAFTDGVAIKAELTTTPKPPDFEWILTPPTGSGATIDSPGDLITSLTDIDVPGIYKLQARCSTADEGKTLSIIILKVEFDPTKVNARNLTHADDNFPAYMKCIAVRYNESEKLDLKDYLKISPPDISFSDINNHLFWSVDNQGKMNSTILDYSDNDEAGQPDLGEIFDYRVDLSFGDASNVIDRLIVVIYSPDTESSFANWYADNYDLTWLGELPDVYSTLGSSNTDPEPANCDPDCWENDIDVLGGTNYYHHDASFGMRSDKTPGGHGHQACYDNSTPGKIITSGISAGTADRSHYSKILGADSHMNVDVKPFIWAMQLDGNPIEAPTVPTNLPRPMMHFGLSLNRYLSRRPPRTASQVTAGNCCDTAYCNTHP